MPVANWSGWLVVLASRSDAPYKTFKEFIEYAKKNPGKVTFGHPGVGNRYWMLGMAMAKETGIEIKDVPFSGEAEYRAALHGGHIDIALLTYGGASRDLIKDKVFRALCAFENNRLDELPDVPTIKEVGYEYIYGSFFIGTFRAEGYSWRGHCQAVGGYEKDNGGSTVQGENEDYQYANMVHGYENVPGGSYKR